MMLLPHDSSSVAVARERVCADLLERGISSWVVEDAALVVSELIGNALRHAKPLPSGQVRLSWHAEDHRIQVAVSDGGSTSTPALSSASAAVGGGRGLRIVDHLAEVWGVHHNDEVTTVWAAIADPTFAVSC